MAQVQQYRTNPTGPDHYISGKLWPPGSIVTLPKGVTPGPDLTPVTPKEAAASDSGEPPATE